jgi:hypothetical protein
MKNKNTRENLHLHVGALADFSSALITLTSMLPERTSLSQASFFLLAGAADIAGKQPTFTELKEALGPAINRSLHSTYRALLTPSRTVPYGAGLLERQENPYDNRQKILKLTPKGREIFAALILEMKGTAHEAEAQD